jgi:hypothetical protein
VSATVRQLGLRRELPDDGAARLLRQLVCDGLPVDALGHAARLVVALEQVSAAERRGREKPS